MLLPWTHPFGALYGHCGWEPLEARIVNMLLTGLKKTMHFSHMHDIFCNKKNKKSSFQSEWSYWVRARTVPKRVCCAELAAACVMWEPQQLPMKTNTLGKTNPFYPENLTEHQPSLPILLLCSIFWPTVKTVEFQNVSSHVYTSILG